MTERTPKSDPPAETSSARETRLAEALRANLRRRKKPAKKPASDTGSP